MSHTRKHSTTGKEWRRKRTNKGIGKRARARRQPPMKLEYGPDVEGLGNHARIKQRERHYERMTKSRHHRTAARQRVLKP